MTKEKSRTNPMFLKKLFCKFKNKTKTQPVKRSLSLVKNKYYASVCRKETLESCLLFFFIIIPERSQVKTQVWRLVNIKSDVSLTGFQIKSHFLEAYFIVQRVMYDKYQIKHKFSSNINKQPIKN
jgi:hypothetical protein